MRFIPEAFSTRPAATDEESGKNVFTKFPCHLLLLISVYIKAKILNVSVT